jgi:hypothetical protein
VDPTFDVGGVAETGFFTRSAAMPPDERIVLKLDDHLALHRVNGSVEPGFRDGGLVDRRQRGGVAAQDDATVVAQLARITTTAPLRRLRLRRIGLDRAVDPTFGTNGVTTVEVAMARLVDDAFSTLRIVVGRDGSIGPGDGIVVAPRSRVHPRPFPTRARLGQRSGGRGRERPRRSARLPDTAGGVGRAARRRSLQRAAPRAV